MELTYHRVDLAESEAYHQQRRTQPNQKFEPFDIIDRVPGENWYVPHGAVTFDKPPDWRLVKREKHVYIPMVPYLLPAEPDMALAFMLQLAAGCLGSLTTIIRLHVATGFPVNELLDDEQGTRVWQYHVGFAVLLNP
jgi:hypothetical protein